MPMGIVDLRRVAIEQRVACELALERDCEGQAALIGIAGSYRLNKALASVLDAAQQRSTYSQVVEMLVTAAVPVAHYRLDVPGHKVAQRRQTHPRMRRLMEGPVTFFGLRGLTCHL